MLLLLHGLVVSLVSPKGRVLLEQLLAFVRCLDNLPLRPLLLGHQPTLEDDQLGLNVSHVSSLSAKIDRITKNKDCLFSSIRLRVNYFQAPVLSQVPLDLIQIQNPK